MHHQVCTYCAVQRTYFSVLMCACAAAPTAAFESLLIELRGIASQNVTISRQNEALSLQHAESLSSQSALLLRVEWLEKRLSDICPQHHDVSMSAGDMACGMSHAVNAEYGRHLHYGASHGFPQVPTSDLGFGVGGPVVRFPGSSPAPPSNLGCSAPAVCGDAVEWVCPACGSPLCDQRSFKTHIYKLCNSHKRRRPQCHMQQRNARHCAMVSSYPGEFDDKSSSFLSAFYDVVRSACSGGNSEHQAHVQIWDWLRMKLPSGVPLVPDRIVVPSVSTSRSSSDSRSPHASSQSSGSHPSPLIASAYLPPTSHFIPGEAPGSRDAYSAL